jgi:hypothetical protein
VRAAQEIFERDGFLDARITDITATARTATGSFGRACLETYHRNAKMMRVVERSRTSARASGTSARREEQTWVEGNRDAIRTLQREGRADPKLDPLTASRALSLMVSRSAYVTFVLEEEGAESIEGLAETLTRLWVNALRIPLARRGAGPRMTPLPGASPTAA